MVTATVMATATVKAGGGDGDGSDGDGRGGDGTRYLGCCLSQIEVRKATAKLK